MTSFPSLFQWVRSGNIFHSFKFVNIMISLIKRTGTTESAHAIIPIPNLRAPRGELSRYENIYPQTRMGRKVIIIIGMREKNSIRKRGFISEQEFLVINRRYCIVKTEKINFSFLDSIFFTRSVFEKFPWFFLKKRYKSLVIYILYSINYLYKKTGYSFHRLKNQTKIIGWCSKIRINFQEEYPLIILSFFLCLSHHFLAHLSRKSTSQSWHLPYLWVIFFLHFSPMRCLETPFGMKIYSPLKPQQLYNSIVYHFHAHSSLEI